MEQFYKTPREVLRISTDFSAAALGDSVVDSAEVEITNSDDEAQTSMVSDVAAQGLRVYVLVSGGTTGQNYYVKFILTLTDGVVLEHWVSMLVREPE